VWRLRPAVWWGAAWAWLALLRVRRRLQRNGLSSIALKPAPCSAGGALGVHAVISRLSPTCLERALILQSWLAARGTAPDVVIGVPPGGLVTSAKDPAHAWLDGLDAVSAASYVELHRVSSPPPGSRRPAAKATRGAG
jgi:hypothetical protein